MSLDLPSLLDELQSLPATLGVFETMTYHEPKNAPGQGVTYAMWVDAIDPVQSSGLAATSVRIAFTVRLYTNMVQEPQDDIDTVMLQAVSDLMNAYSGGFTLASEAREIDLLGQFGAALSAKAGYLNQNNNLYRVMTLVVPVIVDDAWDQEA